MLSDESKPIMPSEIMLSVVMLNVVEPYCGLKNNAKDKRSSLFSCRRKRFLRLAGEAKKVVNKSTYIDSKHFWPTSNGLQHERKKMK